MNEIVKDSLIESNENLAQLRPEQVTLARSCRVFGSSVVQAHITDLVDVRGVVSDVLYGLAESQPAV